MHIIKLFNKKIKSSICILFKNLNKNNYEKFYEDNYAYRLVFSFHQQLHLK